MTSNTMAKNDGWRRLSLSQACIKITDGSHFSPKSQIAGYPYITVKDINKYDKIDFQNCLKISSSNYQELLKNDCKPLLNDLLFSKDGTVGKVSLVDYEKDFVVLSSIAIIRPNLTIILPKFLFYVLKSEIFLRKATNMKKGVALRRIILKDLKEIEIDIPPIKEQVKIVSKIEELFSELDKGIESLKLAQQQIKVYRQSVLKYAFEGRLTNENVKEGELPEGWNWTTAEEVTSKITDGEHITPKRIPQGEMLLSAKNIRDGYIDYSKFDCISKSDFDKCLVRCNPEIGDVVIVSVGATIGRCSLVKDKKKFALVRSVALLKPDNITSNYLLYFLQSPQTQKRIQELSQGSAQNCLYINKIKQIEIPLPPTSVQGQIVQEIEDRFSLVDKMEESINQILQQVEVLRQSVLKRAFEGKLS